MVQIYHFLLLILLPKEGYALSVSPSVRTSSSTTLQYRKAISNYQVKRHKHQLSSYHQRCKDKPLYSSTAAIDASDSSKDESVTVPLSVAAGVGVVSSLVGYLYSLCMKNGFHLLWSSLPSKLLGDGGIKILNQYPAAYIVLMMTLGGGLVATLSTLYFPNLFSAHDFVHILSKEDGAEMNKFPSVKNHLLPVLLLSCITSISGFSLGPEAPM